MVGAGGHFGNRSVGLTCTVSAAV
ncbi:uncharacterized protein METZ01_LOCUS300300 [marine metagenome]|uniref:Uncharacterized protein n=1 Tax=marine metagenome TaxID=408172 RepID=A0A382MFD2_9ZZZZ